MGLASSVLALGQGCRDDEILAEIKQLGDGCLLDSDCEGVTLPGHPDAVAVCVFGRCHIECERTKDCKDYGLGDDIRCVLGDKPTNVCQLDDEVNCADETVDPPILFSARCPSVEHCGPDGECRDPCGTATDCVAEQSCVQGSCADSEELNEDGLLADVEGSGIGTPCSYTSECIVPLVCRDNVCAEACRANIDCVAPATCVLVDSPELGEVHACQSPGGGGDEPHCSSGSKDEDETDVDCGGSCFPCRDGQSCESASDCVSSSCAESSGVCLAPTCSDEIRNGTETGSDCGGPKCPACEPGEPCETSNDCAGDDLCLQGECKPPTCEDGIKNAAETGTDCGGPDCDNPCDPTEPCLIGGDCTTSVCSAFVCQNASCSDQVSNGDETGVDCGGGALSGCADCGDGAPCEANTDCTSGSCGDVSQICEAASCADGVLNGDESDVDCGGSDPSCDRCALDANCLFDEDCAATTACHPQTSTCVATFTLTVSKNGLGSGTVSSTDGKIACGTTCSATYLAGAAVQLSTTAGAPNSFVGWAGACSGNSTCTVTMTASKSVSATIDGPGYQTLLPLDLASSVQAGVVFDGQGNLFSGGSFANGSVGGPGFVPTGAGRDAWVAKYNGSGAHLWSGNYGNASFTGGFPFRTLRLVTEPVSGDLLVAIEAAGDMVAGAHYADCESDDPGRPSVVFARFAASDGTPLDADCYAQGAVVSDMVRDPVTGDIVLVGRFSGTTNFGLGNLTANGNDCFVARYTSGFTPVAAKILGDGGCDDAVDLVMAPGGGFLVTTNCTGEAGGGSTFDSITATNAQGGLSQDICTVRLDGSLNTQWVHKFGGPGVDTPTASSFLPNGSIVTGGTFRGVVDFGEGIVNGGASPRILLLHLGANGQLASPGAVYTGSGSDDSLLLTDILADATGHIHAVGVAGNLDIDGQTTQGQFLFTMSSFGVMQTIRAASVTLDYETFELREGPAGVIGAAGRSGAGTPNLFGYGPLSEGSFFGVFVP